jgi:phage shock protein E
MIIIKIITIAIFFSISLINEAYSILIDVRSKEEWNKGYIEGAQHIPLKNLSTKINEHTRDYNEEILLYCRSGNRSGKAKKILEEMGYVNTRNVGGIENVSQNYGYDIVTEDSYFGSVDNHLNLVYSSSNKDYVEKFYGDILGLKRISDIQLPGNRLMVRYIGGESELKFIVNEENTNLLEKKPNQFLGISMLSLFFSIKDKEKLIEKLKNSKVEIKNFKESFFKGSYISKLEILDFEKNFIEIIFIDKESDNYKFNYSKIVINVSNSKEAESYFQNTLGFKPIKNEKGSFDYKMGKTIIGINELKNSEKKYVGMPHEILGMSLIQFVVKDIPFSRNKILKRGGKIFIEPYNIGNLAVIMFTQGPDGILFEFGAAL